MDNNKLTVSDWVVEERGARLLARIAEEIAWAQYVLRLPGEPSLGVGDIVPLPIRRCAPE